jgi:hypothetical protein
MASEVISTFMPAPPVTSLLGLPPPPAGALEMDEPWWSSVSPSEDREAIENFLRLHNATLPLGCPLSRWLEVLDAADQAHRNQTMFIETMALSEADQGKAHDLIEARRLAWSLRALYAPERDAPAWDRSFIKDQLLGVDDLTEPDPALRMPGGTFIVHFAARLQQAEAGHVRICGAGSEGVDLIYRHSNGGRALIEHKERAYRKSRHRDLGSLVRDVRSRVFDAAEGLQAVTTPRRGSTGAAAHPALVGARVVVVGTSPSADVGRQFFGIMSQVITRLALELAKRGPGAVPHAVLLIAMAHNIEQTRLVGGALGKWIDLNLVGTDGCDEHWKLVRSVFKKCLPSPPQAAR